MVIRAAKPPLLKRFTLRDLVPDSVEVMAAGELSNYNQHPIVSVWERSSAPLLRIGSLRRGSCRDFHGNSAIGGCCALACLHDNCLHGSVTAQDVPGGPVGVAPPDGDWLVGVARRRCCRASLDVRKRGPGESVSVPELRRDETEKQEYFIIKADMRTFNAIKHHTLAKSYLCHSQQPRVHPDRQK